MIRRWAVPLVLAALLALSWSAYRRVTRAPIDFNCQPLIYADRITPC